MTDVVVVSLTLERAGLEIPVEVQVRRHISFGDLLHVDDCEVEDVWTVPDAHPIILTADEAAAVWMLASYEPLSEEDDSW